MKKKILKERKRHQLKIMIEMEKASFQCGVAREPKSCDLVN